MYMTANTIINSKRYKGAVLICPGGGYGYVSMDREGEPIAKMFEEAGFHALVLNYTVGEGVYYPTQVLEVAAAMTSLRIQLNKLGQGDLPIYVCGFSAGGHLAASFCTSYHDPLISSLFDESTITPAGMILAYPVITSGEYAHQGSFINLLGEDASEEEVMAHSLEHRVSEKTPEAFIWHTYDDGSVPVENSLLLTQALRHHQIPCELHIFPTGKHGLALATEETWEKNPELLNEQVAIWPQLCLNWLNSRDLVKGKKD